MSIDPITGIMVAASLVQGGIGLAGSFSEAAALEDQKAEAEIAALQDEVDRKRELESLLSSNVANAAASGRDVSSASFLAIQRDNEEVAARDISNIRFLGSSQSRSLSRQASAARIRGIGGFVGGVATAGNDIRRGLKPSVRPSQSGGKVGPTRSGSAGDGTRG